MVARIPASVQSFLRRNIRSVWQLDLLLYLKAQNKPITIEQIAKALYLSPAVIAEGLKHLEGAGLVKSSGKPPTAYLYSPLTDSLRATADQSISAYTERRVQVINIIFSSPTQFVADKIKLGDKDEHSK
ncbi:MAG TPA: helix-turn-helix domain-containing protein [Candidatus Obscuribacterales bacterium]